MKRTKKKEEEIIKNKEMLALEPTTLLNRYVQCFFFCILDKFIFCYKNSLNSDSDELIIKSKWRPPAEYWQNDKFLNLFYGLNLENFKFFCRPF